MTKWLQSDHFEPEGSRAVILRLSGSVLMACRTQDGGLKAALDGTDGQYPPA
ncbi:hypothetical protein NBRC116589_01830 [Ruegeria sp. HU-ET01832]|uniref:hypothetical protein n=1 Tax=Ruegeria sp. HU-ET01832 TaxID=3135906 RepID=UPI003101BAB9